MTARELLAECAERRAVLTVVAGKVRVRAPEPLPDDLLAELRAHRDELMRELVLAQVEAGWKPGERIAYRDDGGRLETARYAGTNTNGGVNVWTADGVTRAVPMDAIALDWVPDWAFIYEERLAIMLDAGVSEPTARARAEQCTWEYLQRIGAAAGLTKVRQQRAA